MIQELLDQFGLKEVADAALAIVVIIMTQYIKPLANKTWKKTLIPVWVSFIIAFVFHGATTFAVGAEAIVYNLAFALSFLFGWLKAGCITTGTSFILYHLAWERLFRKKKKEAKNEA